MLDRLGDKMKLLFPGGKFMNLQHLPFRLYVLTSWIRFLQKRTYLYHGQIAILYIIPYIKKVTWPSTFNWKWKRG